jgi:ribonuclease Z
MSHRRFYALGTASQVPTRHRNHNGYFLRWDDEGFLFDPGEGTQRQMIYSDLSASQITKIFITHFHGDHCLGLAGILQRLSLDRIPHTVQIFYPQSGQRYLENLKHASIYHNVATIKEIPITTEGVIFKSENYRIEARKLDHTVESWGYRIVENDSFTMLPEKLAELGIKGKDIGKLKREGQLEINDKLIKVEDCGDFKKGQVFAFVMDTRVCRNAVEIAKETDLLVCESTYLESEAVDAKKNGHLTAKQAAEIAKQAQTKSLVLTHFSQRYLSVKEFLAEASEVFPNVVVMKDGDFADLPKRK